MMWETLPSVHPITDLHSSGLAVCLLQYFILSSLITAVPGLTCVQCVSIHSRGCVQGDMAPRLCDGPDEGSTFCLKSVGSQVAGYGHLVFRSCSRSVKSNCSQEDHYGDMYLVCHNTCSEDGCNRSAFLNVAAPFTLAMILTCLTIAFNIYQRQVKDYN